MQEPPQLSVVLFVPGNSRISIQFSVQRNEHLISIATCSLLIEAISGKIIGFSLVGNSDIQTTAAAIREVTVICRLFCMKISPEKGTSSKTGMLIDMTYDNLADHRYKNSP